MLKKNLLRVLLPLLAAIAFLVAPPAVAQSGCSYIVNGAVLTAAQWNFCFAAKNNTLGYTPVNKAGDTMSGKLILVPPSALAASLNMPQGMTAPSAPVNGDMWLTAAGLNIRVTGGTLGPFNTPIYTGASAPSVPNTYSFWNNTAGSTIPFDIYDGAQWVNIGTLNPSTHAWTAASGSAVNSFSAGTTGFTPSTATAGAITLSGTLIGANGGTGVANTGKTITLGASLTTTGAGAATFALGASTQTYTFPTTTATLARTDAGQTFTGTNAFGVLTATSFNGNTFTTGTGVLTLGAGKTLTASNTITLTATDGSTLAIGTGGTLSALAYSTSAANLTGTVPAAQMPAFTGDVTTTVGTVATTIAANAVTNAKSAQMAANTMKGNWTGSTANAADNAMPSCSDTTGNHLNYVSGTGITCGTSTPSSIYFRAYMASSQTVTNNVETQVQYDTVTVDTGSYWNAGTHRYTPLVSGQYQICAYVSIIGSATVGQAQTVTLRKSGSGFARTVQVVGGTITANNLGAPGLCDIVAMNGSTEYLDVTVTSAVSGGTTSAQGNSDPLTTVFINRIGN